MDRARQQTDKKLRELERRIDAVYRTDPSLLRIQKKYTRYMEQVENASREAYLAFKSEADKTLKQELKNAYLDQIRTLTVRNKEYKAIISEFTRIMASVNQKALDLVNAEMTEIYTLNYNQIATDCRKIGIEVNGETSI